MKGGAPLPRVLVVDDEPLLRRTIARELRGSFQVMEAADATEAGAGLDTYEDLVAVVSDLDLGPGSNGLEVLQEASRRRPAALRILISGHAQPEDVAEHVRAGLVGRFVAKPWSGGTLHRILVQSLATARIGRGIPVASVDNQTLVAQVRAGSDDALVTLLARYRRMLIARIQGIHGVPAQDTGDVLQDVAFRLLRQRQGIQYGPRFLSILADAASCDYHRRRIAQARAFGAFAREHAHSASTADVENAAAQRIDMQRALALAKGRCYKLLTTVLLDRTSHSEYATAMGVPRGSIGPTIARCLDKLRRHLSSALPERS